MSKFTFSDPATGRKYQVDAPEGVSQEQAEAIFKQQLDGGSLVGFDVGASLSAVTQAAGGLASAQAALSQTIGALTNKLPFGASLNTITSTLGPGGLAGASQLTSSLLGQGASIATNIIGSSSGAAAAVQSAYNFPTTTARTFNTGSLTSIVSGLSTPAINGINTADLVKQGTGTGSADLNNVDQQAALSQAAKLVSQPSSVLSETNGLGKFGFDLFQLEKAGYIKPGLAATGATISSILNSPLAFTGKDGIKNVDGLLANERLQNNIQQNLMGSGLADLKSVGIPVDALNPQTVAGLANNSAKSVPDTLASLQGTASPEVKSSFDNVLRNSAYAVDYANTKVDPAVLGVVPIAPAENTVNAETLNAALKRIVGNPKVFRP